MAERTNVARVEDTPAGEDGTAGGGTPSAPAAPDWLDIARQAYAGSTSYMDTNYRTMWERNLRQFHSQHPIGSKYLSDNWKGKSRFFRPKTRTTIRKNEAAAAAAYFSTQDVVDIAPMDDSNDMQRASAAFWKEYTNYRLTKSVPWFLLVMGAYQDAQVMGAVCSYQAWDFDEDRPDSELRPLENIRFDPAAKWTDPMGTSPYVIDMIAMYAYEVKEKHEKGGWNAVSDGELSAAKTQAFDSTRAAREKNRTDPKEGGETGIKDFDLVWVHRNVVRRGGVDWLYYTLGTEVLLTEPVDIQSLPEFKWLRKRERPWTFGICILEAHRTMPSGVPELMYQINAELNDNANQRMDNVKLVLNKRYFVRRNRQVDIRSLARNTPGGSTMMDDPEKDVIPQDWNDVTASAYQEQDRLNLDADDLIGSFSGSSVQANRKLNETVGGMNLLSAGATQVGDYTLKVFNETWLEKTLSQMLRMSQRLESDAKIIALAGAKAELVKQYRIVEITEELLTQELSCTVNVGMGATNPINNLERFMAALERLSTVFGQERVAQEMSLTEVSAEIFGKLGYKDGTRFFMDQDDPRIANLTRQVEELTRKLEQKRSPEVDAATAEDKRASAKFKAAQTLKVFIESFFGATQAAEIIAAMPEVAPVADSILQASGYQPPQPAGVDPNIVAPTRPALMGAPAVPKNTSPLEPAIPQSPTAGVNAGIETASA